MASEIKKALALHQKGQTHQAEMIYRKILKKNPGHADANHLLGLILSQKKEYQKAARHISRAIRSNPGFFHFRASLCEVMETANDLEGAIQAYQEALALKPDWSEGHNNLGVIRIRLKDTDNALTCFKKAVQFNPDYPDAWNNLGSILKEKGRIYEAVEAYKKAYCLNPTNTGTLQNLGNAYKSSGDLASAEKAYREVIHLDPAHAAAHRNLSDIVVHLAPDNDIRAMAALFNAPSTSTAGKLHLGFGLGKAYMDLKAFQISFEYLAQANKIMRSSYQYNIEKEASFFGRIKKTYSKTLLSQNHRTGFDNPTPIFILGMPRSGTTLIEQILASHPAVHGAGELDEIKKICLDLFFNAKADQFPESVSSSPIIRFDEAGRKYLSSIRKLNTVSPRITDKMPGNFRYLGLIKQILPNAKIIHCRRHPKAVCFSIFKQLFTGEHSYAYDLKELGHYYNLYRDLMDHWQQVLPGCTYDIQYEKLVQNPEEEIRKLLIFCGLEWSKNCLSFHKTRRPVETASATQVRKPIYKDSVQMWKHYEPFMSPCYEILDSWNHGVKPQV